ncbi:hypothetical protein VW23_004465 [Devosia insulae DS-56]|uniref:PepSY domain-containing protein n=1 Tax=Devosia insulae DS-56 TaxID=1116389 RepID=A0A1E5XIV7_9HYPH|nr:hypothetical protein [Devosia insulae]OEO28517.1 hypothetical protein VW23_004465 [Devosia insulae DS-56]
MKLTTTLALLLAASLIPGSAMARPLQCDWDYGVSEADTTRDFAERLHLEGRIGASVNVWNGCYKVEYLGTDGKYRTEYYDPDSKRRLN